MGSERVWEEDVYSEIKEKLVEENRKYWAGRKNVTQGDKWIYVYHGMSAAHFDWAVREDIVAKGLQEKTNLPIVSVIDGFGRVLPEHFDESFGIKDSVHLFYSKYVSEDSERRTYETANRLAEATYKDKDKMLQMEYRGIKFGDELYDYILLRNWQTDVLTFDCFDISLEQYAHYIRNALSTIDHAFEMFSLRQPAYVITTEKLQLKRLLGDIARRFGAKEIIVLSDWPEVLVQVSAERPKEKKVVLSDCLGAAVKHHMEHSKSNVETAGSLFLFENIIKSGTSDTLLHLGINNHNMNVFILPHGLVDVPRETSRIHFYRDYHEWFLKTIEIIKKIPNVNWIIKDHPLTAYYKQNDYIKRVFMENKTPDMYWCDSGVYGLNLKDVADCIITCGGEAGLEFWAYGIPTITATANYYTAEGISYNMKSQEEYEYTLANITGLAKPSEESSRRAQEILIAMKQMSNCETPDKLAGLFLETRKMQLDSYSSGSNFRHIYTFCEEYMKFLNLGLVEESLVYQIENVCEAL